MLKEKTKKYLLGFYVKSKKYNFFFVVVVVHVEEFITNSKNTGNLIHRLLDRYRIAVS